MKETWNADSRKKKKKRINNQPPAPTPKKNQPRLLQTANSRRWEIGEIAWCSGRILNIVSPEQN